MTRAGLASAAALALLAGAVPAWSGDEQRQPPVAALSVSPSPVTAGEPVVLDGSGSRDPDGSVTSYAFDLDGDGAFERVAGGEARLAHVFQEAGRRSVGLRVVDDSGESGDATATVDVVEPEPKQAAAPPREEIETAERVRPATTERKPKRARAKRAKPKRRSQPVRAAASTTVSIRDFSFAPRSVTIDVGDTVTWRNTGKEPHTATGSGFDTGTLRSGQSGSHTFDSAGTFNYKCTPHPFMTASVTVRGSGGSGGGSGGSGGSGGGGSGGSGGGSQDATQDAGASGSSSADGDSLPSTGLALGPVVLLGLLMIGGGVLLRRHAYHPRRAGGNPAPPLVRDQDPQLQP